MPNNVQKRNWFTIRQVTKKCNQSILIPLWLKNKWASLWLKTLIVKSQFTKYVAVAHWQSSIGLRNVHRVNQYSPFVRKFRHSFRFGVWFSKSRGCLCPSWANSIGNKTTVVVNAHKLNTASELIYSNIRDFSEIRFIIIVSFLFVFLTTTESLVWFGACAPNPLRSGWMNREWSRKWGKMDENEKKIMLTKKWIENKN